MKKPCIHVIKIERGIETIFRRFLLAFIIFNGLESFGDG